MEIEEQIKECAARGEARLAKLARLRRIRR